MVEKKARICDVCDTKVSKNNCEICDKDICEDCSEEIILMLDVETSLFSINTCERCKKQFSRVCLSEQTIFEDVMKDKPELKKEIVEIIKNVMMLHKISDEDMKKEVPPIQPFPRPSPLKPYKPYPPPPYPSPYRDPWKKRYITKTPIIKKRSWWGGQEN